MIAVTVHPAADLGRYILGLKPMRWIGERSYGIYLWHWPVFMVTRPGARHRLTGTPNLILRLAVTVALAELSFRYVEQPIRQGALGRWFKPLRASTGSERMSMAARTDVRRRFDRARRRARRRSACVNGQPAPIPPGFDTSSAAAQTTVTTHRPRADHDDGRRRASRRATHRPRRRECRGSRGIGDSVMLGAIPRSSSVSGRRHHRRGGEPAVRHRDRHRCAR